MIDHLARRSFLRLAALTVVAGMSAGALAKNVTLRFSTPASPTEASAVALNSIFTDAVKDFATFEPHYSATLFKQGTELEAVARGNLEMAMPSAQEIAALIPSWSIFTAGYLLRDAEHQKAVFHSDVGKEMYKLVEDKLGVKILTVFYLGRRHLSLRGTRQINTPADLAGVKLRMPNSVAWQFLGSALGASPAPMAITEVYTALQTGAIDGQDNPLPTNREFKFYEVTNQIVLTGHLVDMNFLAIGKAVWNGFTAEQQRAVMTAAESSADNIRAKRLTAEGELEDFFKKQGLKVYTPDVGAFRTRVQGMYLKSDFAKDWPVGMVDRINAIK
jgi:TRAP-type C4-dicarboxylate transport system substrate-binding protein